MKSHETGSTGLLHNADKLRVLILQHPELPLVVLAGTEATDGEHSTTFCSRVSASLGEFLDCNQDVVENHAFTDREEFENELRDHLWNSFDGTESEFDIYYERELFSYEPYWKPCIIVEVNN